MARKVFMEVTRDELSLPLAIADTAEALGILRETPPNKIHESVWRGRIGKVKYPRFISVEIEEEQE